MPELEIAKKTIHDILSNRKSDFLIPDYQRPYSWQETECATLWDDVFAFAFPENDCSRFNADHDEYFLGPIVTFENEAGKKEIIDGQQRLTTILLLLRAFYSKFGHMMDPASVATKDTIAKCIWKANEFGILDSNSLKIDSEVATDADKTEFLDILRTGETKTEAKSKYAENYRFFQAKIDDFLDKFPTYFAYFPNRILNNCILLPIEAESQDTALRIFSTLNDRGKPLSDSDIFKAQLYKYYSATGKKDVFIADWKELEETAEDIFHPATGVAMDELFTRYMYFERAKQGIKSSTTEALRKFYERNGYSILKSEKVFDNLKTLAGFWKDVNRRNQERFSDEVLRRLFILENAPNGMWTNLLSVFFMQNREDNGTIPEDRFVPFLDKMCAFFWAKAFVDPGLSALRIPVFSEMVEITSGRDASFMEYRFDEQQVRASFANYRFSNIRPITKSMLVWWAFQNEKQREFSESSFDIEHIYARKRTDTEPLSNKSLLESLGNKAILEKRINIRASDYRFSDKKKYYLGFTTHRNQLKKGTDNQELIDMAKSNADFTERDILNRETVILDRFIRFLSTNGLLK